MKEYTITAIQTNNPNIIKFEANHFISKNLNYEFKNIDDAKNSPLAKQLFYLPFVKTVYISGNFIGIERYDIVEWGDVKDEVGQQLADYLNSGEPVIIEEEGASKKVAVTVYAEVTPNPSTMKFVASRKIVPATYEFKNIDEAKHSGLAKALFQFPFVKQVFIDENYVSITKFDVAEWDDITIQLRELIFNYITEGKDVVSTEFVAPQKATQAAKQPEVAKEYDDTSLQIIDILEEYVKPAVASDGGNILFQSYEEESKTVNVILQGACSGCPSSTVTLKNGIETMLKEMLPNKINNVIAANG